MAASLSSAAAAAPCFSVSCRQGRATRREILIASPALPRHLTTSCLVHQLALPSLSGGLVATTRVGRHERASQIVLAQSGETGVTSSAGTKAKSKEIVPDSEFNIAKVSNDLPRGKSHGIHEDDLESLSALLDLKENANRVFHTCDPATKCSTLGRKPLNSIPAVDLLAII
jgi:hypothetical protein